MLAGNAPQRPFRSFLPFCPTVRTVRDFALTLALFLFPFLYPGSVIFSEQGLLGTDAPQFHLPHQAFLYDHLRQGVIPFWNPYLYGGSPEFGNPEMAPMYPFHLVPLLVWGPETFLKIKFLFHLGWLGAGAFLLLRFWSVGAWLALAGAFTLQISGFPLTKISLPNVGDAATWSPLILLCSEAFRKKMNLDRGLWFVLVAGLCLLLFFPQITLTLALLASVFSAAFFLKVRLSRPRVGEARWLERIVLPLGEVLLAGSLLRYPPQPIPFPEPGWRCAFDGMGRLGLMVLAVTGTLWIVWLVWSRVSFRLAWRPLGRWGGALALVWAGGALLAAPQLAVTGEMIPLSNQTQLEYQPEHYFTGAQAFGSVREFIEHSVRATRKESVNNMTLGPLPWFLLLAGIAGGFHRRHRPFALLLAGTVLILLVYMAAPGFFDLFMRLPFFNKFAGLSRYLAFLNLGVVLLASLSAALWMRRAHGRIRWLCGGGLTLFFLLNTVVLLRHQTLYWQHLTAQKAESAPAVVADLARAHLVPSARALSDGRDPHDYVPALMATLVHHIEGLQGYGPIRPARYDAWLQAHNRSLGVSHDDYRAPVFEPVPTRWTRALNVTGFLFPPGATLSSERLRACPDDWLGTPRGAWRLEKDPIAWPCAWPISEPCASPDDLPEKPALPAGWRAERIMESPNRYIFLITNPGPKTSTALAMPWYPGWWLSVNGRGGYSQRAYDFLQRTDLLPGENRVELAYRPRSFIWGWIAFLWGLSVWIILRVRTSTCTDPNLSDCFALRSIATWAGPGMLLTALAVVPVFLVTDSFAWRMGEFMVVVGVSVLWALWGISRVRHTPPRPDLSERETGTFSKD